MNSYLHHMLYSSASQGGGEKHVSMKAQYSCLCFNVL